MLDALLHCLGLLALAAIALRLAVALVLVFACGAPAAFYIKQNLVAFDQKWNARPGAAGRMRQ